MASYQRTAGPVSYTHLDVYKRQQITQSDGTPGSGFSVNIRGVGTLTGDASPLYIVDGFQAVSYTHLLNKYDISFNKFNNKIQISKKA